jgi:hypothetical protein
MPSSLLLRGQLAMRVVGIVARPASGKEWQWVSLTS